MRQTIQIVVVLGLFAGCRQDSPSLIVDISSELRIVEETNNLVIRIRANGEDRVEQVYQLGDAPRDRWPQSLPLIVDDVVPKKLFVAGELRVTQEGRPSVVVGYGETEATFPASGIARVPLEVPRACVDADRDGFGVGFGCENPDCDDNDDQAPAMYFCGQAPVPDAGMRDGGPRDGGPPDHDGGVRPRDGGAGERCGNDVCMSDEACFNDQCLRRCMSTADCGALHLGCLTRYGVCICRLPCQNASTCGPLECLDGCCQF